MKSQVKDVTTDRRSFLKLAGTAAAAGGVAIVAGEARAEPEVAETKVKLYRETEHIRRYYELAR